MTALTAYPETFTDGLLAYNFPTLGSKTRPVAVLSIMASADATIPLRGGPFADSVLADAKDSITLWSEINQCTGRSTSALSAVYMASASEDVQAKASQTVFDGCVLPTEYIEIPCAGHGGAQTLGDQDSMSYAVSFLLHVDAVCNAKVSDDVFSAGVLSDDMHSVPCETLPVYAPPTPTSWPAYSEADVCRDTSSSCTCPPSFEADAVDLPPSAPIAPVQSAT